MPPEGGEETTSTENLYALFVNKEEVWNDDV